VNKSSGLPVVVIGRNEGDRLEQCLRSVAAMRPVSGPVEVIYVDSASTDGSAQCKLRGREALVLNVSSRHSSLHDGKKRVAYYLRGGHSSRLEHDIAVERTADQRAAGV
jgi:glycosyltransferase involved in cell wall biosynthesis